MLGQAAALPGWVWFGAAFVLCVSIAMWRARRRVRAGGGGSPGEGDGWRTVDSLAIGVAALSLLLMLLGAFIDLGNIDFRRIGGHSG